MIGLANPWVILGIAGGLIFAGWIGYQEGADDVRADWQAERLLQEANHNKALQDAIVDQAYLQTDIDHIKQRYQDEKVALNSTISELRRAISLRPQRPTAAGADPVSSSTGTNTDESNGVGCDGSQLWRADSEFLVGLSERADDYRLRFAQCRTAYQTITEAINKRNSGTGQ